MHLGSYGRDLDDSTSLATLVRVLAEWNADVLFRISSLEPMDCTPEIVDLVASSPRLAPHFHLPLQHGVGRDPSRDAAAVHGIGLRERSCRGFVLVFPMRRSAPISSSGFRESPPRISRRPKRSCAIFRSRTCMSSRTRTGRGPMPRRSVGESMVRLSAIVAAAFATSVTRWRLAFDESQRGTIRRALTVDDGWSAVTDNYLKVKLDRRHSRNEWVEVTID